MGDFNGISGSSSNPNVRAGVDTEMQDLTEAKEDMSVAGDVAIDRSTASFSGVLHDSRRVVFDYTPADKFNPFCDLGEKFYKHRQDEEDGEAEYTPAEAPDEAHRGCGGWLSENSSQNSLENCLQNSFQNQQQEQGNTMGQVVNHDERGQVALGEEEVQSKGNNGILIGEGEEIVKNTDKHSLMEVQQSRELHMAEGEESSSSTPPIEEYQNYCHSKYDRGVNTEYSG